MTRHRHCHLHPGHPMTSKRATIKRATIEALADWLDAQAANPDNNGLVHLTPEMALFVAEVLQDCDDLKAKRPANPNRTNLT